MVFTSSVPRAVMKLAGDGRTMGTVDGEGGGRAELSYRGSARVESPAARH
jgi:hypothetical protein